MRKILFSFFNHCRPRKMITESCPVFPFSLSTTSSTPFLVGLQPPLAFQPPLALQPPLVFQPPLALQPFTGPPTLHWSSNLHWPSNLHRPSNLHWPSHLLWPSNPPLALPAPLALPPPLALQPPLARASCTFTLSYIAPLPFSLVTSFCTFRIKILLYFMSLVSRGLSEEKTTVYNVDLVLLFRLTALVSCCFIQLTKRKCT